MRRTTSFAMSSPSREAGFSLLEMMIAMVLGLIVAAGVLSVFQSTSTSNRAQRQMSVLQEEGRFAITRIKEDLLQANSQFCSNTGGNAALTPAGVSLDGLRSPIVYTNGATTLPDALADLTTGIPAPTTPFSLPSYVWMRGYDCTKTACTPTDPNTADLSAGSPIPPQGAAIGQRVVGSSVLTMRYLDPTRGWVITPPGVAGSKAVAGGPNGAQLAQINLQPLTQPKKEPDPTEFRANDLAMLADCSNAQIFAVTGQGTNTLTPDAGSNYSPPSVPDGSQPTKLFDFNTDFNTITYYLKVVDNGNGGTTGALIRRVNGQDNELARGVERLNFMYLVINANGDTELLTADQVDRATDANGVAIPCPPDVSLTGGMPTTGCLWRAVKNIEVSLLMDGQTPLYTLAPADLAYTYTPDGPTFNTPQPPTLHPIRPTDQGFPDQLLRREFTELVSLRNYNP